MIKERQINTFFVEWLNDEYDKLNSKYANNMKNMYQIYAKYMQICQPDIHPFYHKLKSGCQPGQKILSFAFVEQKFTERNILLILSLSHVNSAAVNLKLKLL